MTVTRKRYLVLAAATIALLLASLPTLPAYADIVEQQKSVEVLQDDSQTMTIALNTQAVPVSRDDYSVTVFTIVQWPTADHTVTSQGDFGPRSCRGCSSFHQGDDFNPGGGTPVEVIADGIVLTSGWAGALGESVAVQHLINGQAVVTRYGHMQAGSLRVTPGQHIKRGTILGLVGDTGASTGNHLHFQLEFGGVPVNPMPWLIANVNVDRWGSNG